VNPSWCSQLRAEEKTTVETSYFSRPIPLRVILLMALAIHGPLLAMQLPLTNSYDANFHVFFASHYAHSWFNPWNPKWFAGFSQATYPPLAHQWIALLSFLFGLHMAYLLVQLVAILLVPIGVYRFARLWVDERASSYASLFSVFLGALAFLVYSAGQLPTTLSAPLYLLAIPYFYDWSRSADGRALLKGVVLTVAAGAVHHVTLIFGAPLFAIPVLWLAVIDREDRNASAVLVRGVVFGIFAAVGVGIVLLPYWLSIIRHPIQQMPIPHASRSDLLLNLTYLTNYFLVPYGMLIIALPFIVMYGSSNRRLRPLLLGFWVTFIFGLGGTTPLPKWILGRAFDILTFERFTLSAAFMALPIVGLIAERLIERHPRRAATGLALATVLTFVWPMVWISISPFSANANLNVDAVDGFLNRDGHDRYRYLTLGFGNALPKVSTYTSANSVDGEYNSARLLPEFTHYGTAQLTSAKYFGTSGMEALRMMLRHASHYGLKYIFVHDPFYEPLVSFAGWQKVETYDSGSITVWSREDIPQARSIPSDAMPTAVEGLLWGTLPIGSSILAILLAIILPDRARVRGRVVFPFPAREEERALVPEAK
jgi:hypothetical protein